MVVEDDPYGRLRDEGGHVLPLKALSDDVVYLGTVSKVFAPGLRTGWIAAPKSVLARINLVKQGTDLCGAPSPRWWWSITSPTRRGRRRCRSS